MPREPIPLAAEEVREVQAGAKQIRRRVEPQEYTWTPAAKPGRFVQYRDSSRNGTREIFCPFRVGDVLFVQEEWFLPTAFYRPPGNWKHGGRALVGYPGDPESRWVGIDRKTYEWIVRRKAGLQSANTMPAWASRLSVSITAIRVEKSEAGEWEWIIDISNPAPAERSEG